jgi:uncharacterized membrane protein
MESHAKFLGHPIHPMLIVFPLGLLGTATVFDGIGKATNSERWLEASHYMLGAGLVTGAAAAVPGLIDYLAIPQNTRAKNIGLLHGLGNAVVTGLFAASWWARRDNPTNPGATALTLSVTGTALALVTGWLGGELVDRLGVGVDDHAHVDAPSSLTEETGGAPAAA